MGAFDDLMPDQGALGAFDDLIEVEGKARAHRPGLLREIGGQVKDALIYHLPGALGGALEGDEPFKESDWKDALVERGRRRAEEVGAEPGAQDPLGPFGVFSREDVRSLGPSLGFSGVAMGAGVAAGIPAAIGVGALSGPAAPIAGPVAGFAAGGAVSGKAAYNMAINQFLRNARRNADHQAVGARGVALSDAEWAAAEPDFMELGRQYGLWEAVPEAISNMVGAGILLSPAKRLVPKALESFADRNILARAATKLGALEASELPSETITQMGQHNVELDAGMARPGARPRAFNSPSDWWESLQEVAGPVALQTALMGGAGGAAVGGYHALSGVRRDVEDGTSDVVRNMREMTREMKAQETRKAAETVAANVKASAEAVGVQQQESTDVSQPIVDSTTDAAGPQEAAEADAAQAVEKADAVLGGPADVKVRGKPVADMDDAELAAAAATHPMSAFREAAKLEIARRVPPSQPEVSAATVETPALESGTTEPETGTDAMPTMGMEKPSLGTPEQAQEAQRALETVTGKVPQAKAVSKDAFNFVETRNGGNVVKRALQDKRAVKDLQEMAKAAGREFRPEAEHSIGYGKGWVAAGQGLTPEAQTTEFLARVPATQRSGFTDGYTAHGAPAKPAKQETAAPTEPQSEAGLSPAETARRNNLRRQAADRKQVNQAKDSIIAAITKLRGLNISERLDIIGEEKGNRAIPGVGTLFTKKGSGADDMARRLGEVGYMTEQELAEVDGGVAALKAKLREEYDGRRNHYSIQSDAAETVEAERQKDMAEQQAQAEAEATVEQDITPEWATMTEDQKDDELNRLFGPETSPSALDEGEGARAGEEAGGQEVPAGEREAGQDDEEVTEPKAGTTPAVASSAATATPPSRELEVKQQLFVRAAGQAEARGQTGLFDAAPAAPANPMVAAADALIQAAEAMKAAVAPKGEPAPPAEQTAAADRHEVATTGVRSRLLVIDKPEAPQVMASRQAENIDDYKLQSRPGKVEPLFWNAHIGLGRPTLEHGLDDGARIVKYRLYDPKAKDDDGRAVEVGQLRVEVDAGDKFQNLLMIEIHKPFRQKGLGWGETTLASILAHNGRGYRMRVQDIQVEPDFPEYDARWFWKKMGTRLEGWSADPDRPIQGTISLTEYLNARGPNVRLSRNGSRQQTEVPAVQRTGRRDQQRDQALLGEPDAGGNRAGQGRERGVLPRESGLPSQGLTAPQVRARLIEAFGPGIDALIQDEVLHIIETPAELPPRLRTAAQSRDEAWYDPTANNGTGAIYMLASGLRADRVVPVLLHELGEHYNLRAMLTPEGYGALQREVRALHARGTSPAVEDAWRHVRENYPTLKEDGTDFVSEVIARVGESAAGRRLPFFRRLLTAIRTFLTKLGLRLDLVRSITDEDLRDLVEASARQAIRNAGRAMPLQAEGSLRSTKPNFFYSDLQRRLTDLKRGAGTAAEWKAIISQLPGVKRDEIEWSGVNEWLEMQTGKVARDQVLDFLDQNGVRVEETMLGENATQSDATSEKDRLVVELDSLGYSIEVVLDDHTGEDVIDGITHRQSGYTFPVDSEGLHEDQSYVSVGHLDEDGEPVAELPEIPARAKEIVGRLLALEPELPTAETNGTRYGGGDLVLPGGPLSRDTEILTANGWLRMDAIRVGDTVLTRKDDDGKLEWQGVEAVPTVFAPQLYHFLNHSMNMMVTKNHQMVVKRRRRSPHGMMRVTAEKLWSMSECVVPLTGDWRDGKDGPLFGLDAGDVAEFIGWYLSEGSYKHRNGHKNTIQIAQCDKTNPAKCARLKALFDRLGFKSKYYGGSFGVGVRSMPRDLVELLHAQPTSEGKYIPSVFFQMKKGVVARLLGALVLGDGCTTPAQGRRTAHSYYFTKSARLAGDVQAMVLLTGKHARVRRRKTGLYAVSIADREWGSVDDAKHAITTYNDTAYCVTVKNHAIYVRRNGVAAFTGNSNYRELLLTLPSKSKQWEVFNPKGGVAVASFDTKEEARAYVDEHGGDFDWGPRDASDNPAQFRSSHFGQSNILAHVRFDERTDAEGKKVLFVEEFQSDWAQKGKREGFKQEGDDARLQALSDENNSLTRAAMGGALTVEQQEAKEKSNQRRGDIMDEMNKIHDRQRAGVPAAPFVGKTEVWVSLALKRMIAYGAERGFDKISWTTGAQQADRYSLAKQVEEIRWLAHPEGGTAVAINVRNGATLAFNVSKHGVVSAANHDQLDGKELEDVVGKTAAEKIMGSSDGKLEGAGLKIGGEGMLAFYDRILPNVANDILKKLGGGRVGDVAISPQATAERLDHGWVMVDAEGHQVAGPKSSKEAVEALYRVEGLSAQPGFDITPSLRDRALQGLPLFSRAPKELGVKPDSAQEIRQHAWPANADKVFSTGLTVKEVQAHKDYAAAKAGDEQASLRLIRDLVRPAKIREIRQQVGNDVLFVPVASEEAAGDNKLPQALAEYAAFLLNTNTVEDITEDGAVHHTGADPMERLIARPVFKGQVEAGRRYVLVDDVTTMGGTLAALADHIQKQGGQVAGALVLSNASRSGKMTPSKGVVREIERRYGDEVRKLFGIEPATLTSDESGYIIGFRDAAALQARATAARNETDNRLRARGVGKEPAEGVAPKASRGGGVAPIGATPDLFGNRASWDAPEPGKLDAFIRVLQDKHVDTKRVVQAIKNASGVLKDSIDVYLQEELFHGRTSKGVHEFLDMELRPMLTDMVGRNVTMAELEEYLHARHAEERNIQIAKVNPEMPDGGSGMDTADAREYLEKLDPVKKRAFEALAKRVDAINAKTREELVAYGLESPDAIKAWGEAYQHYVPLQREDMEGQGGLGTGRGFSVRGGQKRATGSKRAVVDIIANIAMQRERAIVRGEKNRVANALLGLAHANPNPDFWRVDQAPRIKYIDDATGLVTERVDPLFRNHENVVMTRTPNTKGEIIEHAVIFNERDERAMRMATALKNLDAHDMGEVLGLAAKVTRYFASINTQYNPVFGIVNLTRDTQGAIFNLSSTPLAGKQLPVLQNTISALRGIYIDERAARKGEQPKSAWAELWEEFQTEGGQTGYRDMFRTSKDRAEDIERELKRVTEGKAKQFGRAVFDWLSDYNQAMENAVRLAAYKVGKESGMTNQRAASLAKNLTVNFNRRGSYGTQVGALYAFFNASVQGTARLAETLQGPAGKKIITGGLLLGSMQALMLAAMGFDDDEPPDFVRERNLIIPIGGKKYITIPMPLGLHILPNLGRIPTEFALTGFRDPHKRIAELVNVFTDAFNPVGNAGLSLQTIAPTIIDPVAALAENKDWTGKPIARPNFNALSPTPGHARAKDTASEFSRAVSIGLNWLSGGTNYKPGIFSPTPDQLDYLIGQVVGGLGREAMKIEQTVTSSITGEELPTYKIPVFGRFFGSSDGQSSQGNAFYTHLKEINEHEAEIKGRRKAGEPVGDYIRENPESRLIQYANKVERQVSALRRQRRALLQKGATKEQVQAIDSRITHVMGSFNRRVRALREKEAA